MSVDPPTDLTYGSEVSIIADDSAFMVMEGHEIGWRFGPPPTKMYMLASTDSALQNANADTDRKVSNDEWLAKAKQKGIRVRSQPDVLVCVVAQDDFEENHPVHVWSRSERMPRCF